MIAIGAISFLDDDGTWLFVDAGPQGVNITIRNRVGETFRPTLAQIVEMLNASGLEREQAQEQGALTNG